MSMPVGCLTVTASRVSRMSATTSVRHTVEQDWYLHPTKGWRRGQKRKRADEVGWRDAWPRFKFTKTWKRY